jgi:hypothetical protein
MHIASPGAIANASRSIGEDKKRLGFVTLALLRRPRGCFVGNLFSFDVHTHRAVIPRANRLHHCHSISRRDLINRSDRTDDIFWRPTSKHSFVQKFKFGIKCIDQCHFLFSAPAFYFFFSSDSICKLIEAFVIKKEMCIAMCFSSDFLVNSNNQVPPASLKYQLVHTFPS